MPIRTNRYYNDPNLGVAFSNLSDMFAPPSGADAAGWATAAEKKQKAQMLADLFANPADPHFDRKNIAAGNYAPTQSFYSVDSTNATSRSNNAADNIRALEDRRLQEAGLTERQLLAPVASGATRFVPQGVADFYGTGPVQTGVVEVSPGERAFVPSGSPEIAPSVYDGAPKPLSLDEVRAGERQDLRRSGVLTDQDIFDTIIGAEAPVKIAGPEGRPTYATPGAAARTGAEAYVDAGSQAKPTNGVAMLPDGSRIPAIQDLQTGRWKHAQTGAELPAGIQIFDVPKPQGTASDVGFGKPAQNNIDQQLIDIGIAKDTAVHLRELIATSPASQGAVGWARGTAQNVIQAGGELGAYFGGGVQEVQKNIADGLADANLAGSFDPNIPAIELLGNLLAFQYAKTTTGERLSNEMLRSTKTALGLDGLSANQASSLSRLNTAIEAIERQQAILLDARKRGVPAVAAPAPAAPEPSTSMQEPPEAAVNMLRANPDTAAQFDEIFGAGASARVLGGQQ